MAILRVECLCSMLCCISTVSAIGWLHVNFYDEPTFVGYLDICTNEDFDKNDVCPLSGGNNYRSLQFQKGTCVELNDSKESVWIIDNNNDLGHSFKGGYAKKCETYDQPVHCPVGTFAKEIEWDTKFDLKLGVALTCYRPEFYDSNAIIVKSHPGTQFVESEKRKCAAIHGITFNIDPDKDANVDLDLKKNCTNGYGKGVRSSCLDETAVSGINFVIEKKTNYIKNSTIICSELPKIASLCKPEDEKHTLLSYLGDTSTAELTLSIKKRIGVGQSLVMSDVDRNTFEFFKTSGFDISKWIPTLEKNFKQNLGLSNKTNFDWSSSADEIWQDEQITFVEIETHSNCTTEVFEIVGRCSFMDVRLAEYVRVDICNGTLIETVVAIEDGISNTTDTEDIYETSPNYDAKYNVGIVKNNAIEVYAEPNVFDTFQRKFSKMFFN